VARREIVQPLPLAETPVYGLGFERAGHAALGPERGYRRGEALLEAGRSAPGLLVVAAGIAREATVTPQGRWLIHGLLGPGDVCGSLTADGPRSASVRAVRPTRATHVSPHRFDALMQWRPDLAWDLVARLERRLDLARAVAEEHMSLGVAERVRRRLVHLASRHGQPVGGGMRIEVPLTQEQLAAMVGATRETANRAIVGMVADGLVRLEDHRYVVARRLLDEQPP